MVDEKYIIYSSNPPRTSFYKYVKDKCDKCGTEIYIGEKDKHVKKFCYKCGGYK